MPQTTLKEFMMLQKTKSFIADISAKALKTAKSNIPATISVSITLAALIMTVFCSAHTVSIYDGSSTRTVFSASSNIEKLIDKAGITDRDYEIVSTKHSLLSRNIEIAYLVPLTVKIGDKENTYTVRAGRLDEALEYAGITVDEHDTISLSLDKRINGATSVEITDVEFVTSTTTETIPFGSEVVLSDKYDTNTSFMTAGKVGTKTITTCVKYVNGIATEVVSVDEKITEYAIDSTTIYGTSAPQYTGSGAVNANSVPCISTLKAPTDLLLDETGKPIKYTAKTTLRATAYTHTGNKMSTGKYPKPGYVAVDPKEIPYGTKMYIVSADGQYVYGYAIAADTGGFIHGTRADMDLFLDTEQQCVKFGRRDIIVYFID